MKNDALAQRSVWMENLVQKWSHWCQFWKSTRKRNHIHYYNERWRMAVNEVALHICQDSAYEIIFDQVGFHKVWAGCFERLPFPKWPSSACVPCHATRNMFFASGHPETSSLSEGTQKYVLYLRATRNMFSAWGHPGTFSFVWGQPEICSLSEDNQKHVLYLSATRNMLLSESIQKQFSYLRTTRSIFFVWGQP